MNQQQCGIPVFI